MEKEVQKKKTSLEKKGTVNKKKDERWRNEEPCVSMSGQKRSMKQKEVEGVKVFFFKKGRYSGGYLALHF